MSKNILLSAIGLAMTDQQADADSNGGQVADGATQVLNGKKFSYFFKTPEIVVKDDEGKEISRTKGEKHPTVEAVLPVPSPSQIADYLKYVGETEAESDAPDAKQVLTVRAKVAALIVEAVEDMVSAAGRLQINEFLEKNEKDPKARFTATNFDINKVSLEYIATLPKGQRGAWAPSEDDMKAFVEDYTNVFVHTVQYEPKKVKVHGEQFTKGFAKIKSDKVALEKMQSFLTLWAANTTNMENHEAVYTWLTNRVDKYMKAEEKNFAEAL